MARGPQHSNPEQVPESFATTALGPADVPDTPRVDNVSFPPEHEGPDPWVGKTLSNVYEVEERIGAGGMGAVYSARHIHLEKHFAIKVLNNQATQGTAIERLRQEAVAASSIEHENIVDVVNFDRTEDGAVYIVMEYLRGESLAACIGRGPIPFSRALPITYQVCRALGAAHDKGIVHRDLKPENIFLTQKGGRTLVKVLDFGISKVRTAEAEQVRMTKTGQLIGTPLYMSPEQARGESDVDLRADIYALGVMLYEMLTGAPPFDGRNYFELLWKHGNEPPVPMVSRNPNVAVPAPIERWVMKSLAKDPNDRPQSMAAFEEGLADAAPSVQRPSVAHSLPPEERPDLTEASSPIPSKSQESLPALPRSSPGLGGKLAIGAAFLLSIAGIVAAATMNADEHSGPQGEGTGNISEVIPVEVSAEELTGSPSEAPEYDFPINAAGYHPGNQPRTSPVGGPVPPAGLDAPDPMIGPLNLVSLPAGASVRVGERILGETPLSVTLPRSVLTEALTFSRPGFLDQTLDVLTLEGPPPIIRLRRRRQHHANPSPIKSSL